MILDDVVTEIRRLSSDTNTSSSLQRFSDTELLGFCNQTLKRMSIMRPDLFSYIGNIPCTDGEIVHTAPSDSIRLMEIFRVSGGDAIRETNRETLSQMCPSWTTEAAAACQDWMRHPRNPNRFFTYPAAPTSQVLIGEYAAAPPTYDGTTTVALLSDAYFTSVVDGTMFLSQSIDDEHVLSQRAAMFLQSFTQGLQVNMESRIVTDLEQGGLNKEDVS